MTLASASCTCKRKPSTRNPQDAGDPAPYTQYPSPYDSFTSEARAAPGIWGWGLGSGVCDSVPGFTQRARVWDVGVRVWELGGNLFGFGSG